MEPESKFFSTKLDNRDYWYQDNDISEYLNLIIATDKAVLADQEYALAKRIKTIQIEKGVEYEDYSLDDYRVLVECFLSLGDIYLKKQAYTKAAALYNFALTIQRNKLKANTQIMKQKLFNIERQFLYQINTNQILIPTFDQHQAEIKKYKARLQVIRDNTRNRLDEKFKNLSEKPDEDQCQKSEATREIFQAITAQIRTFVKDMLEDCYRVLGKRPCQYAIIGLGSLAREEMTPYSDLEWAILIEEGKDMEEIKQYFRNLTDLLHLKVINLGETIIPAMAIESLDPAYDKMDWKFFDDITPRGFAFDGLMPQACKIPHGKTNEKGDKIFELIQTPKKMAAYHGRHPQDGYWIDKETSLTTVLSNWTLIDGNKELIADYAKEVTNILNQSSFKGQSIRQYIFKQLIEKNQISFDPSLNNSVDEGRLFDVKKDLYRIPNLAIDELALYFGLDVPNSSWDKIDELNHPKKLKAFALKDEAAERLKWVLSETMRFRLLTYLHYNKQQEQMNPLLKYFNLGDKKLITKQFALNPAELQCITLIYQTLMPLDDAMQALAKDATDSLKKNKLFATDPFTLGKIANRLCQYKTAEDYYEQALEEIIKDDDTKANILLWLGLVRKTLGKSQQALTHFKEALAILKKLYGNLHPDVASPLDNIGNIYLMLNKNEKAFRYFNKALVIRQKFYGNLHLAIASSLNNIGTTCHALSNDKEALQYFSKALIIRQKFYGINQPSLAFLLDNMGLSYHKMGNIEHALKCYKKALSILGEIYGFQHPHIAKAYNNIGKAFRGLNNFEQALQYHQKALAIWKALFGEEHPDVAICLNDNGLAYHGLDKYDLALKCFEKGLNIFLKLYGVEHADVATTFNNLGMAFHGLGRSLDYTSKVLALDYYEKALECYKKVLAIYKKIFKKQHWYLAAAYNNLGLVYNDLGNISKALEKLNKALSINLMLYGQDHPEVALVRENIQVLEKQQSLNSQDQLRSKQAYLIKKSKINSLSNSSFFSQILSSFKEYYDKTNYITDTEQVTLARINNLLHQKKLNYDFKDYLQLNKNHIDAILEITTINEAKTIKAYLNDLAIPSEILNFPDKTCLVIKDINGETAEIIQAAWDKHRNDQSGNVQSQSGPTNQA